MNTRLRLTQLARSICWLVPALGLLASAAASAQVRPAYIKNVDERGRAPFEMYVEFSRDGCSFNCTNFLAFESVYLFDAPAVPAGKRLVVEQVTGRLPNNSTANVSVALQSERVVSLQFVKWAYFGPFQTQFSMVAFRSDAFATYGPGEQPHFNLVLPAGNNFFGFVTLSGYLIDANN